MSIGKNKTLSVLVLVSLLISTSFAGPPVDGKPDHNSVYDYAINWAVQTGATEITVEAQARYCSACNPNWAGNPGCAPFTHTGWCYPNNVDGTYIAVRIKNAGGTILAMKKLVLQSGVNLTLNTICKWQFVFSGLSVSAGDILTVEADTYCSWCGHWYPNAVNLTVIGSDSEVTYTGETTALVGTSAAVCGVLLDADTGDPLIGKTVTFTLNPASPFGVVSAITDDDGIACTTMPIPAGTPAGTYTMDTRFAGDVSYFPCSDQDPFEVIVVIPVSIDIKPGSYPNAVNINGSGVIPIAILGSAEVDVWEIDPTSLVLVGGGGVKIKNNGSIQCSIKDISGDFSNTMEGEPDGWPDLVCQFVDDGGNVVVSEGKATVEGCQFDGTPIKGCDTIKIVKE